MAYSPAAAKFDNGPSRKVSTACRSRSVVVMQLMYATSAQREVYRCPGEDYSITGAVHLARMAAHYEKCRDCPHAADTAGSVRLGSGPEGSDPMAPQATHRPSLFTAEGVRGRYLNEITRGTAERLSAAAASCLWDEFRGDDSPARSAGDARAGAAVADPDVEHEGIRLLRPGLPGPCVVIAHDERPASPDLVIGVGQALRRMGCQVVDIGLATRPCFLFAVDHLQAAGGILVSGSGCGPGWGGLDFVGTGGLPCSSPGELDQIARRLSAGFSRPARRVGSQRVFEARVPYEASLCRHFHALRPLKIALACSSRAVCELFARAFRKVACRLIPVETPTRARVLEDANDPDLVRTAQAVREANADLGILVEEDGEQCVFFDERGQIAAPPRVAALLADLVGGPVLLPAAWGADSDVPNGIGTAPELSQSDPRPLLDDMCCEHITRAMKQQRAALAADGDGRYWFDEGFPACDALLTLVQLLHALSRSDTSFSKLRPGRSTPA